MKEKTKRKGNEKQLKLTTLGFTLIELLAVIVILAIIALISTPIIIGVIEKAKMGALENSSYGIMDAIRLHFIENGYTGDVTYKIENEKVVGNNKQVSISGDVSGTGEAYINEKGDLSLFIEKDGMCALKSKSASKVSVVKANCEPRNLWRETEKYHFTKNGITVDYDPESQIYTLNGTTTDAFNIYLSVPLYTFKEGEKYTIYSTYVSGKISGVWYSTIAAEAYESENTSLKERQFTNALLNAKDEVGTTMIVTKNTAQKAHYMACNFWINGTNGGVQMDNLKFKVHLNKGEGSTTWKPSIES